MTRVVEETRVYTHKAINPKPKPSDPQITQMDADFKTKSRRHAWSLLFVF